MDIHNLLSAWPIDEPVDVQPLSYGNNNLSYAVTTRSERYILRIYQNAVDRDRVQYEHTLLARLARTRLSFAVPAPVATRSSSTLMPVLDDAGQQLAALFHLIPGHQPDGEDLVQYCSCGRALGELDRELQHITIMDIHAPAPFGEVSQLHP